MLGAHAEAHRERLRELDDERHRRPRRQPICSPTAREDRRRPRHEQDLALEYNAREAHERLRHLLVSRQGVTLELTGLGEQLEEIDREYTAWPTRLREACDAASRSTTSPTRARSRRPDVLVLGACGAAGRPAGRVGEAASWGAVLRSATLAVGWRRAGRAAGAVPSIRRCRAIA